MALFTGLGSALGAAAQGYGAGSIRGEQYNIERQRREEERALRQEEMALRKLALEQKNRELDPDKAIKAHALEEAGKISERLRDPALQGFYQSPEGRAVARHLHEQGQRWLDVGLGRAKTSDIDTFAFSAPWVAAEDQVAEAPVPGAAATAEVPAPPRTIAPFLRPPGTSLASFEGVPVAPGPTSLPRLGPPVPQGMGPVAPRAAPAAPARPKTRLQYKTEAYDQIAKNRPIVPVQPGMTPKEHEDLQAASDRVWQNQVNNAAKALEIEIGRPAKVAAGKIAGARAGRIDVDLALKAGLTRQQINTLQATEASTRALTPIKKKKGEVDIGVQEERRKAIPRQVQQGERRTRVAERGVAVSEGQLSLAKQRETRLGEQSKKALAAKVTDVEAKRRQERIKNNFRIVTSGKPDRLGIVHYEFSEPRRNTARRELETDLEWWGKNIGGPKPAGGGEAQGGGGGTKMWRGKPYTWKKFLSEGRANNKGDSDIKSAWAAL